MIGYGELSQLYEDDGLSMQEVADRLGCGKSTVARAMRRYGIESRSIGRKQRVFPGDEFGFLTIVSEVAERGTGGNRLWVCTCACGNTKIVNGRDLVSGDTVSCGCRQHSHGLAGISEGNEFALRHGHARRNVSATPTYQSWKAMRARCRNPNVWDYKYYGGRGISVCERWDSSFVNFLEDMGERPAGHTLDRIDPDGDYEPGNCRWATPTEQNRNQRLRAAS